LRLLLHRDEAEQVDLRWMGIGAWLNTPRNKGQ
jgi:hypothetical protein